MTVTIGSLFSGVGGLELGVEAALGGRTVWQCEFAAAPSKVLAARFPGVPNFGDITTTDWAKVPKVDVMCGGYPCQPFSTAGKRRGQDDERHLWPAFRDAIRDVGPSLVVLENVRGHLSLGFGDVLADLAGLGFDAEWGVFRSSEVGAPHRRERLFVVATDAYSESAGWDTGSAPGSETRRENEPHRPDSHRSADGGSALTDTNSRNGRPINDDNSASLGRIHTRPLAADSDRPSDRERTWQQFSDAIERWETITGTRCPNPVDDQGRMNPELPEWMMGFDHGWITDVGLSRTQALKCAGNAVQQQTAALAVASLVSRIPA